MTIVVTALVSQYRFVRLATVTRIVSSGRIVQSLLEQLRKKIQNEIGRLVPLKYGVPRTADLAISETPKVGTVDDWVYIKTTGDTHPMHMHLVTFQVVDLTPFDAEAYEEAYGIRTASQAGIDPTPFCHRSGNSRRTRRARLQRYSEGKSRLLHKNPRQV